MRCRKIITLSLQNITSFLEILTGHFTGKEKILTLCSITLILSLVNIINASTYVSNVSALNYESNVGVGFTFNPTLSISLSSNDLVTPNLTPGTTADSNAINVSILTNASHGYTLAVNTVSEDLTHNDNNANSTFSSIATNANLENLTVDNTWGYSYKLSNGSNNTWSNYNGLSTNASTTLINTDNQTSKPIDFKIAAKASSAQPSGIYTGTINFIAISKPIPRTIEDIAYMQTFGELNPTDLQSVKNSMILNQDYILKDSRDEKEYYVTRLEDGNIWMTQNLDLDLDSNRTYTHYDTDLGWSTNDSTATWRPAYSTSSFAANNPDAWTNSYSSPRSADLGQKYVYTSNSKTNDTEYDSLQECITSERNDCAHYNVGNYYNWAAAIASNGASRIVSRNSDNSICPSGWKLPATENNSNATYEFEDLLFIYGVLQDPSNNSFTSNGLNLIRIEPLYFVRGGTFGGSAERVGAIAQYWSSSASSEEYHSKGLYFTNGIIYINGNLGRNSNISVRCLAR